MQVKILPGGTTAKEVNPYGENMPSCTAICMDCKFNMIKTWLKEDTRCNASLIWQEAESKLRTFEIENINCCHDVHISFEPTTLKVGSIHTAELLTNGKIKIV